MKFEIRSITEQDIEQFRLAVGSVAREKHYLAFLDSPSSEMAKDFVLNNIKESWPHVIAVSNNKVIGWCDIVGSNRHACKHLGTLGVGIVNEYRGNGTGRQLMNKALELAEIRGLTRIELAVRDDNARAIHLYKTLGFNVEGKYINSLLIDGKYYDQISMALLLD